MSFGAYDVDGFVGDVASMFGWFDFCDMMRKSGIPELVALANHGYTEDIYKLIPAIERLDVSVPLTVSQAGIRDALLQTANKAQLVFIISDGIAGGKLQFPYSLLDTEVEEFSSLEEEEQHDYIVRHEGNKWVVRTEDGGRVLGTHDTEEKAKAQLRAIEANKRNSQEDYAEQGEVIELFELSSEERVFAESNECIWRTINGTRVCLTPSVPAYFGGLSSLKDKIVENGIKRPVFLTTSRQVAEAKARMAALGHINAHPVIVEVDIPMKEVALLRKNIEINPKFSYTRVGGVPAAWIANVSSLARFDDDTSYEEFAFNSDNMVHAYEKEKEWIAGSSGWITKPESKPSASVRVKVKPGKAQGDLFGVWRTINGRKVFIRTGETAKQAMERSLKSESSDSSVKKAAEEKIPFITVENFRGNADAGINKSGFINIEGKEFFVKMTRGGEKIELDNEAAAWLAAKALGWTDIAVPAYVTSFNGEKALVQELLPKGMSLTETGVSTSDKAPKWLNTERTNRLFLYEYAIGSRDRHGQNYWVDTKDQLWSIDQGRSFVDGVFVPPIRMDRNVYAGAWDIAAYSRATTLTKGFPRSMVKHILDNQQGLLNAARVAPGWRNDVSAMSGMETRINTLAKAYNSSKGRVSLPGVP